jgi:uncharacterized protein with von Willebrand factor type A (vWA) domain
MQSQPESLSRCIVEFSRFARNNGLSGGVKETIVAVQSAAAVGLVDPEIFKCALRSALCSCKQDWELFDGLFECFWAADGPRADSQFPNTRTSKEKHRMMSPHPPAARPVLFGLGSSPAQTSEDTGRAMAGASSAEQLKKTDFAAVPLHDQAALEKIALRLLRRMSLRLSRRLQAGQPGGQLDLRRMIRRNISRGGEPMQRLYRWKKRRPSPLVVMLDISGSMNLYSLFFACFAHSLQQCFRRMSTFVFSTHLLEITDTLKTRDLHAAFEALSRQASGWSGGTKIGESLAEFNRRQARRKLTRDTLFVILSDGWDTGEPEVLARELRNIRSRVRKLIWLNPLLGLADYQPATRAMKAVLPYIDVFAPAHNLESLLALERHLTRSGA